MITIAEELGFVALGLAVIVFCDFFARQCVKWQNKTWGFHFGERAVKWSRIVIVLVGMGWIALALLALFGIIQ
jgi:hypothetical protein